MTYSCCRCCRFKRLCIHTRGGLISITSSKSKQIETSMKCSNRCITRKRNSRYNGANFHNKMRGIMIKEYIAHSTGAYSAMRVGGYNNC